jgi:hypothetical protein
MSDVQTPPEGTEPESVTSQDAEPETPQAPVDEVVELNPSPDPAPTEQTPPAPQPTPPGFVPKDKFVASGRESILNAERVKAANAQIEQLTKQDTPTDEAMRKLYPEWDQLDEYNKRVLIRQEALAMQTANTQAKQLEIEARQKLEDQLDDVVDNSEFAPKLKGKEMEFKRFARNPKNRGIAAETLAKAFLFDAEDETPVPTPMAEALPAGSGGPRGDLKPKKISIEEARKIRETDYKRYVELVKTGQIEEIE